MRISKWVRKIVGELSLAHPLVARLLLRSICQLQDSPHLASLGSHTQRSLLAPIAKLLQPRLDVLEC
jgi:hypothetical protein